MRVPPSGPPDVPGFSAPGLKDAVAQSRSTGLPIFDMKSANDLLSGVPKDTHRALLMEAAHDPGTFVTSRFSLTEQQTKDLANLTPQQKNAITNGLHTALRENLAVQATCIGADHKPPIGEQKLAEAGYLCVTKMAAPAGSITAKNGFSGTLNINIAEKTMGGLSPNSGGAQ